MAFKYKGKRFIGKTLIATISQTAFLGILPNLKILPNDNLLNTIVGENDQSAFVIVSDVREALGEGFVKY